MKLLKKLKKITNVNNKKYKINNNKVQMLCVEATKYPKIYSKTYWGKFTIYKNGNITEEIISNRNELVEKYGIISKNYMPQYIEKEIEEENKIGILDHKECYKTKNKNYILVSSPYSHNNDEEYEKRGWEKIHKLYSLDASSYIKIIPMRNKKTKI